ncbi:hypothetical protein [Sulfurimonas sp.]
MKKCASCKAEISKNAKSCPHCGEPAPKKTSLFTWLVLILIVLYAIGQNSIESAKEEEEQAKSEKIEAEAKKRQELARKKAEENKKSKEEFSAKKEQILSEINDFTKNKKYEEAVKLIEKYKSTKDIDIIKLEKEVSTKHYLAKLKKLPASKAQENLDLYKKLSLIHPSNDKYKKKIKFYVDKVQEQRDWNKTGMWRVGSYVDSFGDDTKSKYITNQNKIRGTFSNSATQNSKLDVTFLIDNYNDIAIQLYEYARSNPVKDYDRKYYVHVKHNNLEKTFYAKNYSDRLVFINKKNIGNYQIARQVGKIRPVEELHSMLKKGGRFQFYIYTTSSKSDYSFVIDDSKFYKNAYRMLKEK